MITINLRDFRKEDMKDIAYLKKNGVPDDVIQAAYDKTVENRNKENNDGRS